MSSNVPIDVVPRRRFRRFAVSTGLCFLWAPIILYPNPTLLPRAVANAYDPQVDPEAVRHWADQLPDDPAYIERQVESTIVPYAVPWETHGVPWYYPTTREVVETGRGDCQGRMLVFASILEAKGIPYKLRASIDHIWVEYENKQETSAENAAIAVMDDGQLTVPSRWDWRQTYEIEKDYFWDPAPLSRKLLLFTGLLVIGFRRVIGRTARRMLGDRLTAHGSVTDRLSDTVRVWEAEGRLTATEAQDLHGYIRSSTVARIAPHLGAHVAIGLLVPFPFASIGRAGWTIWNLSNATRRWIFRRIDKPAWRDAWSIHHPLIALVAAVPLIGSFAYLLAAPIRRDRRFLQIVVDAGLSQMPWRLYERSGARRVVTRGNPILINEVSRIA